MDLSQAFQEFLQQALLFIFFACRRRSIRVHLGYGRDFREL